MGDNDDARDVKRNVQNKKQYDDEKKAESSVAENIYSVCCGDSTDLDDEKKARNKPVADWIKNKDSKIVIIGAGPAGIHMAAQLQQRGYTNVIILEKQECLTSTANDSWNERGKSVTIRDEEFECVHEMGTCYLHPKYDEIRKLLKEYDPENTEISYGSDEREVILRAKEYNDNIVSKFQDNEDFKYEAMEWDEWLAGQVEKLTIPEVLQWIPDAVSYLPLKAAAEKYQRIHKDIFGDYHDEIRMNGQYTSDSVQFPPRPKPNKDVINMTTLQFMIKNDLQALIPNFIYNQSIQGILYHRILYISCSSHSGYMFMNNLCHSDNVFFKRIIR